MEQQTSNLTDIIDIETTFPDLQALNNNLQNSVNLILCENIRSLVGKEFLGPAVHWRVGRKK